MEEQMTITPEMAIGDVVRDHPNTVQVFLSHGLMCFGCGLARFENIRQGAEVHGIDVDTLVEDLNKAVPPA